jgi:predicted P-loop ATPase
MGKVDRCRAVWDKYEFAQKRQCVLFATTNDDAYLQSQTGNRRWWPIKVTKRPLRAKPRHSAAHRAAIKMEPA